MYLIGIDIGTSGTKTVLFDYAGNTVASATFEYPLYQPQNGWAEQDADDFVVASFKGVRAVLQNIDPKKVVGVSLSGQMHGLVMLDKDLKPIRKCIIWCDQRTESQVKYITDSIGRERLISITANPAVAGFTASKLMWIKQNEPQSFDKCEYVLLPKDYVRFKLTGILGLDVSDASGTGLLNVKERKFSTEIIKELGFKTSMFSNLFESSDLAGTINEFAAKETGLLEGISVAAGAGDQAAAAVGNGIVREGIISDTLGTSGVVFAHTDNPLIDPLGRVHTFCHAVKNKWHIMGVTQSCGLSLRFARDNFAKDLTYDHITKLASSVPPQSEGLIFLPYLMGERTPHLDSKVRGMFFGLSNIHTTAHLIRSVMEGISFSQLDCLSIIRELGVSSSSVRVGGGGAKSEFWRQMLADMFECPTAIVNSTEGGALGAAILAGVAAGVYKDVESACEKIIQERMLLQPKGVDYSKNYGIYKDIYKATKELFARL